MHKYVSERESVALHEAAHAVVAIVQGCPILDCVLDPYEGTGRVNFPPFVPEGESRAELRKHAIAALAGWAAQLHFDSHLILESHVSSIEHDERDARRCVGNAVEGEERRQKTLKRWRTASRQLVEKHADAIRRVADALMANPRLTAEEMAALIEGPKT